MAGAKTLAVSYELEYGNDQIEIHADALGTNDRVLVVDDLIATGGTAKATVDLVERSGATVVACAFLIELTFLAGREVLGMDACHSVIRY